MILIVHMSKSWLQGYWKALDFYRADNQSQLFRFGLLQVYFDIRVYNRNLFIYRNLQAWALYAEILRGKVIVIKYKSNNNKYSRDLTENFIIVVIHKQSSRQCVFALGQDFGKGSQVCELCESLNKRNQRGLYIASKAQRY